MAPRSDLELLRCVAAGGTQSDRALEELLLRHRKRLLVFLLRRGANPEAAEDVVQELFLRVRKSADTFKGASEVSTWLFSIANRLLIDQRRATSLEQDLDDASWDALEARLPTDEAADPGKQLDQLRFEDCVKHHYAEFVQGHPAMAEALAHVVTMGWRSADLALAYGKTDEAARQYLTRCRRMLKRYLRPCSDLAQAVLRG
jgi:RNA polymerase sigma-70 factor, ECF subfamily